MIFHLRIARRDAETQLEHSHALTLSRSHSLTLSRSHVLTLSLSYTSHASVIQPIPLNPTTPIDDQSRSRKLKNIEHAQEHFQWSAPDIDFSKVDIG